jgi:hypothetical protein
MAKAFGAPCLVARLDEERAEAGSRFREAEIEALLYLL